jgi:hypothetical protein
MGDWGEIEPKPTQKEGKCDTPGAQKEVFLGFFGLEEE